MLATRAVNTIVAILALCQVAAAFFPFMPQYRCVGLPNCVPSTTVQIGASTLKMRMEQLLPETKEPRGLQIRQIADRLARKYNRGTPVQSEAEDIEKRTNTFPIVTAATPTQTDSAGIDQDGTDYSYFGIVDIGSNNTALRMLLDTGGGSSWVMGSMCTSAPCYTHNTFGPADSQTYISLPGEYFDVTYGTGSVSGLLANDTISFADMKFEMTLGIANVTSDDFSNYPMDGILGLSQLQSSNQPNFIQSLVASKLLQANVFGVDLNRNSDGPNNGEINFGAPDTTRYSGSLSYTPVSSNSDSDWAIPIDNIGWNGQESGITGRLGYLDTGTSFIFCPAEDAQTFHALIPGSAVQSDGATYTVPCSTTAPATFTFSGVTYNVSSEDWVGPSTNGVCTSNIYGQPVIDGAWLLGDTFLINVYTLFDIDENRVGLAEKLTSSVSSQATATSTGGPNSLSNSLSTPPSSTSALAPGSGTSISEINSNGGPTGSASGTPTSQTALTTGSPSLNGQQTSGTSGQSAGETSSSQASPTPSKTSHAMRVDTCLSLVALALFSIISFI